MSKYFIPFIIVVFSTSVLASKDGIKPQAKFPKTLFEMSEDEDDAEEELDDDADEELVALHDQLMLANPQRPSTTARVYPVPLAPPSTAHFYPVSMNDAYSDSDSDDELEGMLTPTQRALLFAGLVVIGSICTGRYL